MIFVYMHEFLNMFTIIREIKNCIYVSTILMILFSISTLLLIMQIFFLHYSGHFSEIEIVL